MDKVKLRSFSAGGAQGDEIGWGSLHGLLPNKCAADEKFDSGWLAGPAVHWRPLVASHCATTRRSYTRPAGYLTFSGPFSFGGLAHLDPIKLGLLV